MRAFVKRTPFQPFVVELVSGTRLQIIHPEALLFGNGHAVYLDPDGEWSMFDHDGVSQITSRTDQAASA
jgi:hypothetical protein